MSSIPAAVDAESGATLPPAADEVVSSIKDK
jgi:hypothetical protein